MKLDISGNYCFCFIVYVYYDGGDDNKSEKNYIRTDTNNER